VHGVPTDRPGAVVASVSECVVPASQATRATTCGPGQDKTPAYLAGLRSGDVIVSIAGTPVATSTDVGRLIRPRIGEATPIVVERAGTTQTLIATPVKNTVAAYSADGAPILDANGQPTYLDAGFLGISSTPNVLVETQPLTAVPGFVGQQIAGTAKVLVGLPKAVVTAVTSSVSGTARPVDSPMSVVGVGRIAGEAVSGELGGLRTVSDKVFFFLGLTGSLNIMLLLFNLIPLLPFDGGQAAGAVWEGTKRAWARLRGRPDPGFVDVAKALPMTYAVSLVLVLVTVIFSAADIINPIKLGG
jgi:membrane-associated protease RseP (regulator of RpoE activity)